MSRPETATAARDGLVSVATHALTAADHITDGTIPAHMITASHVREIRRQLEVVDANLAAGLAYWKDAQDAKRGAA